MTSPYTMTSTDAAPRPARLTSCVSLLLRLHRRQRIHCLPQQLRDELFARSVGRANQVHAGEVPEGRQPQEARVLHSLQHRKAFLRWLQASGQCLLPRPHHPPAALRHLRGRGDTGPAPWQNLPRLEPLQAGLHTAAVNTLTSVAATSPPAAAATMSTTSSTPRVAAGAVLRQSYSDADENWALFF